jgi:sulfite reductase (NADPH) flavoprotein alpha-component
LQGNDNSKTVSIIAPGSLSAQQSELLVKLTSSLDKDQLTWVSGYLAGFSARDQGQLQVEIKPAALSLLSFLTILYGSRTGNGEGLAKKAQLMAEKMGIKSTLKNMVDYRSRDLQTEKNLLIIVSTHGEGVPPFSAAELHEYIYGKRAPKLESVNYAVLALGDSSYFQFCKTGKDFDEQLEKLGGKRIVPILACDLDFEQPAEEWLNTALSSFGGDTAAGSVGIIQSNLTLTSIGPAGETVKFSKKNPFKAPVFEKIALHGKGSERQTFHIELSADSQGLEYEPGDSAGVIPVNPAGLINELIEVTALDGAEEVEVNGVKMTLYESLRSVLELSKITVDVVKRFQEFAPNSKLQKIIDKPAKFKDYLYGRDIVDLLQEFPVKVTAGDLVKLLRPLQPRSYSISSSPKACPGELHLTVGEVNYENNGRRKQGTCSTFLAKVDIENEQIPIFIEPNQNFRLPKDTSTPIVMIGAGTGIAPYRAFVQHRELSENRGKSWLFFGNRNFETEFLYQTEWQNFLKSGALTRMDVAFSRDGSKKKYVQHRLIENSAELYKWLKEGAHFYICGDMNKMAGDVQAALVKIVEKEGEMNAENAREYVNNLQKDRRLQLDVY